MGEHSKWFTTTTDADVVKARLQSVLASFRYLSNYFQVLEKLSELTKDQTNETASLSELLTERAYEAEKHARILIKHGLDALNDLRDTGELASAIQTVNKALGENPEPQFLENWLSKAPFELKDVAPELDEKFWTSVQRLIKEQQLKFEAGASGITVHKTAAAEGLTGTLKFPFRSNPGDLGRVSVAEFFGVTQAGIWTSALPFRRKQNDKGSEQFEPRVVDQYGESVNGLLELRDLMYRHARETEAFGLTGLRGGAIPFLIALIIFIIAVVALVAGTFLLWLCGMGTGTPGTCIAGGLLVAIGVAGFVCLGVPACAAALAAAITIVKCTGEAQC